MTRKIQLTTRQLNDLMADLAALPAEPIGSHLSDEALFGYTMETLDAAEMRQVDLHLASCVKCAAEAERLADAWNVWFGEAGERRSAALRERVLGQQKEQSEQPSLQERFNQALERMVASLQAVFQPQHQLPLAADTQGKKRRQIWKYDDESLRGHAVLDWRNDVTFRFTSKDMAQAGRPFIIIRWGKYRREVVLKKVSATEVGAKVVILSHEAPDDLSTLMVEILE